MKPKIVSQDEHDRFKRENSMLLQRSGFDICADMELGNTDKVLAKLISTIDNAVALRNAIIETYYEES